MLYIIATPIGNLDEITKRALDTLNECDFVACEDTRRSGLLLNRFGISKPLIKYETHSEATSATKLLNLLREGKNIALISDAGMPLISDPGSHLITACIAESIPYTVISGPCACINAVVLSGFDTRSFCMLGFLPDKKKDRDEYIDRFADLQSTLVLYCPPHDLDNYLDYLHSRLGSRKITIVRELTKIYEDIVRGELGQSIQINRKGEMVIVIEGAKPTENPLLDLSIVNHVDYYIKSGMTKNEAIKSAAKDRVVHKNEIYKEIVNS